MANLTTLQLFKNIKSLVEQNKQALYAIANTTLTETYFHKGRLIVENEQQGNTRATYAKETLLNLSAKLTTFFGKGFSVNNLENMRKFYTVYKEDYLKYISKNQKSEPVARKLKTSIKSETVTRKSLTLQKSESVPRKLELQKLNGASPMSLNRITNVGYKKIKL